jgi:hypothetical protein
LGHLEEDLIEDLKKENFSLDITPDPVGKNGIIWDTHQVASTSKVEKLK